MISIQCDECSKSYKVKPEMAGKKAKCKCGASIVIPQPRKKQSKKLVSTPPRPKKTKPKPKPESDPWDEDPWDDDFGGEDYEADDEFDDGFDDLPRRPQRGGSSGGRSKSNRGGRSKKGRKKKSGGGSSAMKIVGMVFGGIVVVGLLLGFVVKPVGAITAGILTFVGIICYVGGALRCLIAAFEEDIMCGILWLFVPFYSLYYIISRFSELAQYILLAIGGVACAGVGMGYLALLNGG